jgi:recombination protein RecA
MSVNQLISSLEKRFGRGILMPLDGPAPNHDIVVGSTGSFALDRALGGGLPFGRIVEIYGPEASGKTTLALSSIAAAQQAGHLCAFVDAEHAFSLPYALDLGADPSQLLISQPDCGEDALEVVEALVRSGEVKVVVVDSVAALTPRAEIDGEMGDQSVGLHARLMSKAMRKLTALAHKHGVLLIFINQLRMKIGVMFGSPETTTGGNALKFYASVRLDVRRAGRLTRKGTRGDDVYGIKVRVKVLKNKVAPPFRTIETELHFGRGFRREAEVLDAAIAEGIVERSGSHYRLDGESLGQGRERALEKVLSEAALLGRLEEAVGAAETACA